MGTDGGISNDDTLADNPQPARSSRPSLGSYELGATIGEGGMGEVVQARDPKIGRDVAIKRMRGEKPTPELVERFLREAKIQARLDHPAIVPVYDLGNDANGAPFFTMKRLAGTTLLERLSRGDGTLQALLRAFVGVCQAIDFAHARKVVHRDLKPANIILGEYGEVYVLDWGVARVLTRAEQPTTNVATPSVSGDPLHTQAGAVLGTPGYMAPEQARGEDIGTEADVYSLGKILGDILRIEAKLGRDVPPEVDAIAIAARAEAASERPTARELAQRVQSYLDGDRDLEQRAKLAAELVLRARTSMPDPELRANVIRDAGRALALHPDSQDAASLVMSLMMDVPKQLPIALGKRLDDLDVTATTHSAKLAARVLPAGFLFIPLAILSGVMDWPLFAALWGLLAVTAAHAYFHSKRPRSHDFIPLALGAVMIVLLSRLFSPFVLTPVLIAGFAVGVGSLPGLIDRPLIVLGLLLTAFLAPFVLEAAGVLSPTWEFAGGRLELSSRLIHLTGAPAAAFLIGSNAIMVVAIALFARTRSLARRDAQRQLEIQAWQLQQLLPAPPPSAELDALISADCA